jgi:hypothetical protein
MATFVCAEDDQRQRFLGEEGQKPPVVETVHVFGRETLCFGISFAE